MNYLSSPVGFHRLLIGPLDDMEVFSNTKDLMEYCKNGTRYNGQRVAVDFGSFVQQYTIRNNVPLLQLEGQELVTRTINGSRYVLIYYQNGSGTYSNNSKYTNFDDPFKFIMFDTIDIFKESNGFSFYLERIPIGSSGSTYTASWTQTEHPLNDNIDLSSSSTITKIRKAKNTTSGYLETNNSSIVIMPRSNNSNYCTKIYIKADTYLSAEGVY